MKYTKRLPNDPTAHVPGRHMPWAVGSFRRRLACFVLEYGESRMKCTKRLPIVPNDPTAHVPGRPHPGGPLSAKVRCAPRQRLDMGGGVIQTPLTMLQ
jgi:hypothetical protein